MIEIHKLENDLLRLPGSIYEQEKKVLKARERVELAKMELRIRVSAVMLNSTRPNATEKRAEADANSVKEKKDLIREQLDYEKELVYLAALNNKFTAIRKVSSIETELMKTKIIV